MRRALAAAAVAALVLTGCGGTDTPEGSSAPTASASTPASESPSPSPTASPSDDATEDSEDHEDAIAIEIKGDEIEPRGKRVEAAVGQEITLHVESDRPAELHVHSSPEQVLEAPAGESMLTLTIDTPGVVDIEEHESGIVVLQLEVR